MLRARSSTVYAISISRLWPYYSCLCTVDKWVYFIIVQVRNRRDDSVTPSLRNESERGLLKAFKILKHIFGYSLPHIAIMMCLRCRREQEEPVLVLPKRSGAGPETPYTSWLYIWRYSTDEGRTRCRDASCQKKEVRICLRRFWRIRYRDRNISRSSSAIRPVSHFWEKTPRIVLLCVGFKGSLYPAIGVCGQKANNNTKRIREHLTSVLDCIPEESIPSSLLFPNLVKNICWPSVPK